MKIFRTLYALGVASFAIVAEAQGTGRFSQELIQGLRTFSSSDPVVTALITAVEDATDVIDSADSGRKARASNARTRISCKLLKLIMPGSYTDVTTNAATYDVLRQKNWSGNCDLPAQCFITPEHPVQVAVALQVVGRLQTKFAVRSGGHNPNPGFAAVGEEGVTIDTGKFTALGLSADKSVATVGAGLRFGPVQDYLDARGVAVVSGRNREVGVAGLILGGGHPIINSLTGLAADNIKSAEVVLSNFRVVKASKTENSDLFRALKGGGNNFGVVTKFELTTTQPRNLWYRNVIYNAADAATVLPALAQVQINMESDPKAGIQMTCSPETFTVAFVYGEHANNPAVFAPFNTITPASERTPPTNGTTLQFIGLQTPPQPEASRDTVGVTTVPNADLYRDIYNQYLATVAANAGIGAAILLPIQTYGSAAVTIAESNGGNVLGASKKAQTWWNPIAQWPNNPAVDGPVHAALIGLANYIKTRSQAAGLYDELIFANIGARDQDVLESYGSDNWAFIKTVSEKYDPKGVFQRLQNGGFLISN